MFFAVFALLTSKLSVSKIWESLFTCGIESPLYCRAVVISTSILENKIREMLTSSNPRKFSALKITGAIQYCIWRVIFLCANFRMNYPFNIRTAQDRSVEHNYCARKFS